MKQFCSVVLGTVVVSCLLGICIDVVTANVAVEYFSQHHPKVIESESPWLLALIWGVGASWWFGLIAGCCLATTNNRRQIPMTISPILKGVCIASTVIWLLMILILISVYSVASLVPLDERTVSFESDRRLMSVAMAHQAEYVLGSLATLFLVVWIWRYPDPTDQRECPDTRG